MYESPQVLFMISGLAFAGGVLLMFIELGFFLFRRTQSTKLFANCSESIASLVSILLALAGFTALFVASVHHQGRRRGLKYQ